jgi:hypothetical protein
MTNFEGLSCSAAAVDIPLAGSATQVTGWLCVEQPGAWGRDVIGDEVLGPQVTAELAVRTKAAGVRPMLIRRPGRNETSDTRTVVIAGSRPRGSWCERFEITDLKQLLDLDLRLLNGPAPGIGVPVADPPVLVCTHGKRDQCCALSGRSIAARLAAEFPDQVWECSHTGGHRFAPAMVVLPSGLTYGRVDGDAAVQAVTALRRNRVLLTGFRGRSCCSPVEQVAEIVVRELLSASDLGPDDLTAAASPEGDPDAAVVTHRDGRRWLVTTRTIAYAPRQASCGAAPKPATAVIPEELRELP